MTTVSKFTTPGAAGVEVDRRATRYMSEKGSSYREAINVVLAADKELARAYAAPATRVAAKPDPRSPSRGPGTASGTRFKPAVPVTTDDEREIFDWVIRALKDDREGALPGALGSLALEAAGFKKIGMPADEAARRAMASNPHLVTMAKILLADVRRNENKPETTLAQGSNPGETVHIRAQALITEHPHLDYREAMGAVLNDDPGLKVRYAGVER